MNLDATIIPGWTRIRRAFGASATKASEMAAMTTNRDYGTDRRERRLDHVERIYMAANVGLCGDVSLLMAVAEILERDRLLEMRNEQ